LPGCSERGIAIALPTDVWYVQKKGGDYAAESMGCGGWPYGFWLRHSLIAMTYGLSTVRSGGSFTMQQGALVLTEPVHPSRRTARHKQ
jgi:hypothetical protein